MQILYTHVASNPGSLLGGGEREPGTHLCMCKVYGAFSSIIRQTLSLPRGRTHIEEVC